MTDNLQIRDARYMMKSPRISSLKEKTFSHTRWISIEQARIITRIYRENRSMPVILKRAMALSASLKEMTIAIDPEELIIGNRTPQVRAGVVFPEAGISWIKRELDTLSTRPQDPFHVREEDKKVFLEEIEPYWSGITMEDQIYQTHGEELHEIGMVVKINQKDHAQGHICPDVSKWLNIGPAGLLKAAKDKLTAAPEEKQDFYRAVIISLEGAIAFIQRYANMAGFMAENEKDHDTRQNLESISAICVRLTDGPPGSFREALQALWFLFVMLHMESNASSFSPGRMDQYLYPFFARDMEKGLLDVDGALELIDALFIKFNQIVYLRNANSAKYFAGFPIGFNVSLGGQTREGKDATNFLSYLFLKAQDHIGLPQPNLTARLHEKSPDEFVNECSRVIGMGSGMPQIMNDESIIPALELAGIEGKDALDYSVVGCVELSSSGNYLGWSDAAMFNLVKILELTLNDGECLISGRQIGLNTGNLADYSTYEDLEAAFGKQIDYFTERMIRSCEVVEKAHQAHLPSPFLSSVIDDCLAKGDDVTAGGAVYNFSGIQAIQVANISDSLAVLKSLVFEKNEIDKNEFMDALRKNYKGKETLRIKCMEEVPKYGNDISWVDELGSKWIHYFYRKLKTYKNYRGGDYILGLYTVSAHVPMGANVGATPDGRLAASPLADGGISPMYGQDMHGPTAVLGSVSRVPSILAANGTLLNMKFLPAFFETERDRKKFSSFLKAFIRHPIHHVQFNVVNKEDLIDAKKHPEKYLGLTIRVAGYTAYFVELASDLQDEIIERTCHAMV